MYFCLLGNTGIPPAPKPTSEKKTGQDKPRHTMKQTSLSYHLFQTLILPIVLSFCVSSFSSLQAASKKKNVVIKSVEGCWQICQAKGQDIPVEENLCFLNFDCLTKKMNGFASCNYIHGKFQFKAKKKTLEFAPIASTRMACPQAGIENEVLDCLQQTRHFSIKSNDTLPHPILELIDAQGNILLSLAKMMPIDGKWTINQANDSVLDTTKDIFLFFNSAQKTVHGKLGCNTFSAPLDFNPEKPQRLHIGQGIRTLMSCPDMELENTLLQALQEVVSFKKFSDRKAILSNAKGKVLIELNR